jgi:hypothetical protein
MPRTLAYAAPAAGKPLVPFAFDRREPLAHDVDIDVRYCGVCHSDLHQARDEWSGATFPMVPGHEIVGTVRRVGAAVTRVKVGDLVGVGCLVDACRTCTPCRHDTEQFCEAGPAFTYNGTEMDRVTPTFGGYATRVVVTERFVLKMPTNIAPEAAAPLLCAGITTYSPLKQWGCKPGDRVAVVGLGGLGHMAVKLAVAMGAEVTVFSTSRAKEADARRMGDGLRRDARPGGVRVPGPALRPRDRHGVRRAWLQPVPRDAAAARGDGRRRRAARADAGLGVRADHGQPAARGVADRRIRERPRRCSTSAGPTGSDRTSRSSRSSRSTRRTSACSRGDVRYRFVIDLASLKA